MPGGVQSAPGFTLPEVGGEAVPLASLLAPEGLLLVFAHGDCPTSVLALRMLAAAPADGGPRRVLIAEGRPEQGARLARRTGVRFTVLAQDAPYDVSRAYGVEAVPTAVLVDAAGAETGRVVGWDRAGYRRLGVAVNAAGPEFKPGCSSLAVHPEPPAGGLDEVEEMYERGFSDGLPVVPPTPERVEAMLAGRDPVVSLGDVPPAHGTATLERVAACAVLAGCRPEHLPVVIAAVEAALDPAFNAHGIAVTTQPAGTLVIVNGPGREALGLNSGMGVLGPGTRANATIGRALRLVLTLTGGAGPGRLDRSTLGHPAKMGLCIAEAEEASPWEPLHVERGFPAGATTVTVLAADAPLSVSDHRSRTPQELATVLARAAEVGWSPFWWPMDDTSLFVICPEHAALFGAAGWSKARLREFLFETAVRPAGELRHGETTPLVHASADETPIHKWAEPGRIEIVCAGGEAGRYSAVFGPCDGMGTRPVTREVRFGS